MLYEVYILHEYIRIKCFGCTYKI